MVRQSKLLSLSRSTAYYTPRSESEQNLTVMKEIDRLYMEHPTSGSRTIKSMLEARGVRISMDGKGCWLDNVYVGASGAASSRKRSTGTRTRR